jgi:2-keto-3-deoxy-L-rhamnonate aldolase RhmA
MTPPGLLLWLISGDSALARIAHTAGIARVLVDLERLGKAERQAGRGLFLSTHDWSDAVALRAVLPAGALFIRLDPLHDGSADQVERALGIGVDGVMLPYFHRAEDVFRFADLVRGRAVLTPLVETRGAVRDLPAILASGAIGEFHVGLNDLALDLGLDTLARLWGDPLLAEIAAAAQAHATPFGIGGVTDPRATGLPVSPTFVLEEHRRLGSTRALLGRSFRVAFEAAPDVAALRRAVAAIEEAYHAGPPADAARPLTRPGALLSGSAR